MVSFNHRLSVFFAVNQIIYSPCGCQRAEPCGLRGARRRRRAEKTVFRKMVGLIGLEPMTPALSRRCSNQLSYRPGGLFAARFHKRPEWWRLTDSNR